jgi:Rrf2 family nitric oxide-sensitive transcriptional repressor
MRITRYTDYSLRVLMYLGVKGEGLATIQEIADRYQISRNHLMKVVYDLNQHGYIETVRGKGGGMRLRARPEKLRLGDLIRTVEQDLTLVECFGSGNQCRITPVCTLKGILAEALEAFFDALNQYTLADLLAPGPELGKLLGMDDAVRPVTFASRR